MELRTVSPQEYKQIFDSPYHVFNTADFNTMTGRNRNIDVEYLVFRTSKPKMGLVAGVVDTVLSSPFSAPFGGFSYKKEDVGLEAIDEALHLLFEHSRQKGYSAVNITLPPTFYAESFLSKLSNCFYRKEFSIKKYDLNYSISLNKNIDLYKEKLHYNARKNLNISLEKGFTFQQCNTIEDKQAAYEVIKQNRESRGFPLRLSFETIKETINIINADFFLVKLDEVNVAAAMIFHVSKNVVQVVYWGDLPEYASNKTMNFLSYHVVQHYSSSNIRVIDIGPSTEDSIPNYGLCDFKESIGCDVHSKLTWSYAF